MPRHHEDLASESIAKVWHQIAGVISIAAAVSGVGITLTAGVGALWHRWAVKQHQIQIDRLRMESSNDSLEKD